MNNKFLSQANLELRPVEPEDADFMWEVDSDSKQWIQNSICGPLSKENLLQYAISYEADPFKAGQLRLIITERNLRVGIIDLFEISAQHRTAKIGIYILPSYRRFGYAKLSLQLLEDYCCRILNLRLLCAEITEDNNGSLSLFQNAGYQKAGVLKNWLLSGKKSISVEIMLKQL